MKSFGSSMHMQKKEVAVSTSMGSGAEGPNGGQQDDHPKQEAYTF